MLLTLEVLQCLPVIYLAALLLIVSNLSISSVKYGSQTEQTYSNDGRNKDLYACSFTEVELMFKFLFRKPKVLIASLDMLFICLYRATSPGTRVE